MVGRICSIETLGTLDGPGVRFIAFMHGCNLSCGYCHNGIGAEKDCQGTQG